MSFLCQIAKKRHLILTEKAWYYLDMGTIEIDITREWVLIESDTPGFHTDETWIEQGAFSKDQEGETKSRDFAEMTQG